MFLSRPLIPLEAPSLCRILKTLCGADKPLRLNSFLVPYRITESTSSCGSAGTIPGWSYRRTSSPIRSPSIPRCSNAFGSPTCSSPTRRAPTFMTSPRRTFSSSFSVMEMSSSAWGNEFYLDVCLRWLAWMLKCVWITGGRPMTTAARLLPVLM